MLAFKSSFENTNFVVSKSKFFFSMAASAADAAAVDAKAEPKRFWLTI